MARKILIESRSEPAVFTLIGISCHLRDYHLTHLLNRNLDLNFVREDDFRRFPFFFCRDENGFNVYYLLGNRGEESVLLPDMKQTDYLLLIEGPFKKAQKDKVLKSIRGLENVLTTFEVNIDLIRNFETILNDLEMHFLNIHRQEKVKYSSPKK